MLYCILNGVKSTTLKGFMIQSLPPISKPLMRTSVEEIDGRDGDIVTKLGYSAYDKQMTIGLFGDYDIDEIIQYFDSEGEVIFSNEPDKFYRYQIIQQIDFERLIRFKTATVTFHVQPFKFSAVDDSNSFTINELNLRRYADTVHGVNLKVENGLITLKGNATSATEFYVPINPMTLEAGDYTLQAKTSGTVNGDCFLRVIGSTPTDADSFGGTYLPLFDGESVMSSTLTESKTYNYLWFNLSSGTEVDFALDLEMLNEDLSSCQVFNRGNVIARPKMTIYGAGEVVLSINDVELFTINLANVGWITLDGQEMNAYKGDVLMNRSVSGDYSNLTLKIGKNIISWSGYVTGIDIENVSRWI